MSKINTLTDKSDNKPEMLFPHLRVNVGSLKFHGLPTERFSGVTGRVVIGKENCGKKKGEERETAKCHASLCSMNPVKRT